MIIPTNQYLDFNGRKVCFHKIGLKTENLWMMWATRQLPNPIEAIKHLQGLPADVAKELATQAYKDYKRGWAIDDPEIEHLKRTPQGAFHSIRCLIQLGEKIDEQAATDLLEQITEQLPFSDVLKVAAKCAGELPDFFDQAPATNQAS
jgi:hypothetical protein